MLKLLILISAILYSCQDSKKDCTNKAINYPDCNKCEDGSVFSDYSKSCMIRGVPVNFDEGGEMVQPKYAPKKDDK